MPSNAKQCQSMPNNSKQCQASPSNAKRCQAFSGKCQALRPCSRKFSPTWDRAGFMLVALAVRRRTGVRI
eukprot:2555358-Pyramimonas_sp.AAC.1